MGLYRKRPLTVEAEQFWPNTKPWPEGVYSRTVTAADFNKGDTYTAYFCDTLEGTYKVKPGDWIIKGEHYPCELDIFEATYEAVEAKDGKPHE